MYLRDLHRLSAELASPQRLGAGNLHDYRKRVKELDYLTQFLDHSHAQFAETLGTVKDAIGEWHDWEELAAIAERLLDHRPACNLRNEIHSIRRAKFEHALAIANEMRTKGAEEASRAQLSALHSVDDESSSGMQQLIALVPHAVDAGSS
jgi:CHAD domain-containing protein